MPSPNHEDLMKIANSLPISEFWGWVDEWLSHEDVTTLVRRWNKKRIEEEIRYLGDKISARERGESKGDAR